MDRRIVNNPLSLETIDRALDVLQLSESATVLDVGCGRGEMLARVMERFGCRGIGIDLKVDEIELARQRLAAVSDRVKLYACSIEQVDLSHEVIQSALCIGATHAYGNGRDGLSNTLAALIQIVQPGGTIVVAEGFWKREPEKAYLTSTGFQRTDLRRHEENAALAAEMGLTVLYAITSSQQEWDHFESLTWLAAEDRLRDNPADQEAQKQVEHWRKWQRAYLRWGRETLGFGLYLLRLPKSID